MLLNTQPTLSRAFKLALSLASLSPAVALGACSKSEPQPSAAPAPAPIPPPPQAALTAPDIFKTRCATCHGESGHGDGPAAVALNPKPRNYSDPEWQKTVTDDQIKKTIVGGGVSVGKSPLMVPNPDLAGKEDILDDLVKIIRSFAPPPS